ncbi:unnamed protein product [Caenorhabditis nigoni]
MNSPDQEQAKFIAQLNQERKKVANQWNITNMHELTWSKELSDIVATISRTDYQKDQSISPYSIMTYDSTDYTALGEGWKNALRKLLKEERSIKAVNSLHTKIACVKRTNYKENVSLVCLLGPENTPGEWKKGEPGSECKWRYTNSDGICKWDTAQEKFIDELNYERRNIASLGFHRMRKLIWNEELHNVVKDIKPSNTTLQLDKRGNWRFTFISNYTTGLDELINVAVDNVTVYKFLYWRDEHINPFQSAIACSEKSNIGYGFKIMCLFGFEKNVEVSSWISKPGNTDCGPNYKREQELCVLDKTPLTQKPPGVTIPPNGPPNPTSASSEVTSKFHTSSESPNDPKQTNQSTTQGPNSNSTFPGPRISGNSQRKFPETRTLPKELEDYVEVDGDDYDEDFPTGEPLLDSGFENFSHSTVTLDEQQSDFINSINKERRYFAKTKQIGNMHKLYWDQGLQKFVNQLKVDDPRNNSYLTPVLSMDQDGINELNRARDKWWPNNTDLVFVNTRHEYMYPLQTTVACARIEFWPRYNFSCFFGPKMYPIDLNESLTPGTDCLDGFTCNENGLCAKCPPRITSTPETATLPTELEDYVEVDGDDYDEDFPTGEPPLDSGFKNFLQFWITVFIVLGSCVLT